MSAPEEQSADEGFGHGPLQTFEITWQNGHVEKVQGHQVSHSGGALFGERGPRRFAIHGDFDGHWTLVITAPEDDTRIIRNVTAGEWVL
ncbi:MAG: hypothetical protein JWO67_5621 [Streptosporangiaceae bacterium]|nr:hypothetical protein [Streptosporangiaceae bacterium]